jgi:hypothetical protein
MDEPELRLLERFKYLVASIKTDMHNFKELKVWKFGIELSKLIFETTREFQASINLESQIRCSDVRFQFHQILPKVVAESRTKN